MAETNATNQSELNLSKLNEILYAQLDKFGDAEALLDCASDALSGKDECAESARRVICIARGIISGIHDQIDQAALEFIPASA